MHKQKTMLIIFLSLNPIQSETQKCISSHIDSALGQGNSECSEYEKKFCLVFPLYFL